ncbi:hypothetical protein F2Q70_00001244 [Brassica cretica]|uniref:Uncharacterized protein n=1 Tax=Brassica cretica TaxID=69181 RepID=A0A8S9J3X5_BRACR|nr:hypothetical protein F2Q70_00001244 [Brassica cretica]
MALAENPDLKKSRVFLAFRRTLKSIVLIRLMASSMTKRRVQLVDGDAHVSDFWRHINKRKQYKVIKCNMFNYIKGKSKTVSEIWSMSDFKNLWTFIQGWNQKAKEEINLQKDVQVSVQALDEQVEVMETHNGNEIDTYGVHHGFKEDHEGSSSLAQGGAERRLFNRDTESNDIVNHIEGVFRYFIVDVVDPGSTPDVAVQPRSGRDDWCASTFELLEATVAQGKKSQRDDGSHSSFERRIIEEASIFPTKTSILSIISLICNVGAAS